MIFIKPWARKLAERLYARANAHEANAYNPNLKDGSTQNQHLTVAWALRSVAGAIEEVIGDAL